MGDLEPFYPERIQRASTAVLLNGASTRTVLPDDASTLHDLRFGVDLACVDGGLGASYSGVDSTLLRSLLD